MKQLLLQTVCDPLRADGLNATHANSSNSLLSYILRGCASTNGTSFPVYVDIIDTKKNVSSSETGSGAVMYMIAVLVFYSFGIIVMMIKYLRREKRELEEERILEDFFRTMQTCKKERQQHNVNRVAIHAFHTLTSIAYDDDVFSSDVDDDVTQNARMLDDGRLLEDGCLLDDGRMLEDGRLLDDVERDIVEEADDDTSNSLMSYNDYLCYSADKSTQTRADNHETFNFLNDDVSGQTCRTENETHL